MIQILIWIVTIPSILIAITLIPFPDIPTEVLTGLTQAFSQIYFLNQYFPIDELFKYALYILGIELAIIAMELIDDIRSAATGAKPLFGFITRRRHNE